MTRTDNQVLEDSIFKIGKVIAVKGRTVEILVDKAKNTSHLIFDGKLLKNTSVGGYVKIVKGFTRIIGKVEGEFIEEDRRFKDKKSYASEREKINRVLSVSMLGFFNNNKFERGIKELPLLDNECFLLHTEEFEQVHDFIRPGDTPITIGNLSFEKGQEIRFGVNGLFASHIGIFGNTGSGKSYSLAKIYRELFLTFIKNRRFRQNSRFFIIDFNGEYVNSDSNGDSIIIDRRYKNVYRLSTKSPLGGDKFPIAESSLFDSDFWIVFLEATEKTQTPFLRRAIDAGFMLEKVSTESTFKEQAARMIFSATNEGDRSLEKNIVTNFLKELRDCLNNNPSVDGLLEDYSENMQYHSSQHKFYYKVGTFPAIYSDNEAFRTTVIDAKVASLSIPLEDLSAIDKVRLAVVMQYYDDIIRGFANKEHLAPIIKRLDKRVDDLKKVMEVVVDEGSPNTKNITILSLRDVNVQMRKILPLLLCKKLYNDKKLEANENKYLNIIVDEAHNILSENSDRESEQWKDYRLETFEEIIKEGRKFGVFLTIASQRPSDISPTIISQLHNYFLHRLINNEDIRAVERTISYLDKVSFEYLPILPTGTCIVAGLLANVPVIVDIGTIKPKKHEPKNKTITLVDKWT